MPVPPIPSVAPALKFDPVSVTETLVPWVPLFGEIELSTGAPTGAVIVTVALPVAEGETVLAACTCTLPPDGGTDGAACHVYNTQNHAGHPYSNAHPVVLRGTTV